MIETEAGRDLDIVAFGDEQADKADGLDRILEPLRHPDVLARLPAVISRLKQASGEDWAIGDALARALENIAHD